MSSQTTPWILFLAIWVHICFGISILVNPDVSMIAILTGINVLTESSYISTIDIGVAVIICALLALIAIVFERHLGRTISILLIFPQYSLLMIALVSDIYVLSTGKVNNREVNIWILFSVLNIMIGLAIFHTIAVIERYWRRWIQV